MEKTKTMKMLQAIVGIFLFSIVVASIGFSFTGSAKEKDTTLADLTQTLEIKASELKEAKENEQALSIAYKEAVKVRELKQSEKTNAVKAIDDFINSGLKSFQKPENLKK